MMNNLIIQIPKDKPLKLKLSKGNESKLRIDENFFKKLTDVAVPYIILRSENSSKNILIDPLNHSFIKYDESTDLNYTWGVVYNNNKCEKVILMSKQNSTLGISIVYPEAFPTYDCVINDQLEILPLGSVSTAD